LPPDFALTLVVKCSWEYADPQREFDIWGAKQSELCGTGNKD